MCFVRTLILFATLVYHRLQELKFFQFFNFFIITFCLMIHDLKCIPPFFSSVLSGEKNFEIRKNDRGFAVGDLLLLREWLPSEQKYTNAFCIRKISYILPSDNGLIDLQDWIVMSIVPN